MTVIKKSYISDVNHSVKEKLALQRWFYVNLFLTILTVMHNWNITSKDADWSNHY